ncbi:Orf141 [Heliothis zea nudivirus]|uniref:Orf141 n=1 Tax=Heliothis zea nudivirus 1 TaxID=3116536 RepID=Q8JKH2_9VIRU|nr:Orf141 [Heliothis zea nudivirus]AAN04433.1 Orf141 [Heliothis zea nudivirus]
MLTLFFRIYHPSYPLEINTMVTLIEIGRFLNGYAKNSEQLTLWLTSMDAESMYCCIRLFIDKKWRRQLIATWRTAKKVVINMHDKCACLNRWGNLISKQILQQIGKCDYESFEDDDATRLICKLLVDQDEGFVYYSDKVFRSGCSKIEFIDTVKLEPCNKRRSQQCASFERLDVNYQECGQDASNYYCPKKQTNDDRLTIVQLFKTPHHLILKQCTPLEAYIISSMSLNVTVNDLTRSLPEYYRFGIRNDIKDQPIVFDLFHGMYNFHVARSVFTCDTNLMAYYKLPSVSYETEATLNVSDLDAMCSDYCVQPSFKGVHLCLCLTEDCKYYMLNRHGVRVRINNRAILRALPSVKGLSYFCGEFMLMGYGTSDVECCLRSYSSSSRCINGNDEAYCFVLLDLYLVNGKSILDNTYEERLDVARRVFADCYTSDEPFGGDIFKEDDEVDVDSNSSSSASISNNSSSSNNSNNSNNSTCTTENKDKDHSSTLTTDGTEYIEIDPGEDLQLHLDSIKLKSEAERKTRSRSSECESGAYGTDTDSGSGTDTDSESEPEPEPGTDTDSESSSLKPKVKVKARRTQDTLMKKIRRSIRNQKVKGAGRLFIVENFKDSSELIEFQSKCDKFDFYANGIIIRKRASENMCTKIIKIPFERQHWRLVDSQGFECEVTLSKYDNPTMCVDDLFPSRLWAIEQQSCVRCKFNAVCYGTSGVDGNNERIRMHFAINNGQGVYVHFFSVQCIFRFSTLCYDLDRVATVKSSRILVDDEPHEWFVCRLGFAEAEPPFKTLNSLSVRFDLSLSDCVNLAHFRNM